MLDELAGRRVLLLQGPNGPFFRRLAQELKGAGAIVRKIHLNPADAFYFLGLSGDSYRGTFEDFPQYVAEYVRQHEIEACFLFGDYRPYHRAALPALQEAGVEIFVFEEGYLRPDYVTIERDGVNARSTMPRDPDAYGIAPPPSYQPLPVRHAFAWSVLHTIVNSLCITLFGFLYPHYRHHRDVNTWRQALLWGRSFWRRAIYARKEAHLLPLLSGERSKRYFLLGLQVHNDSQVMSSQFGDVRAFIEDAVKSFAHAASADDWLVVKHHPADRAYRDYGEYLKRLSQELGISERVVYVHDLHLPTLLQHARGTVVLNSTIGFSSLHHGTPVIALGESIYGYMGLTAECSLDQFWNHPPPVDARLVEQARNWLLHYNQANGSIWTALPGAGPTGLRWPEGLHFPPKVDRVNASVSFESAPIHAGAGAPSVQSVQGEGSEQPQHPEVAAASRMAAS